MSQRFRAREKCGQKRNVQSGMEVEEVPVRGVFVIFPWFRTREKGGKKWNFQSFLQSKRFFGKTLFPKFVRKRKCCLKRIFWEFFPREKFSRKTISRKCVFREWTN